ncbi:retrovirus-related pol polyprotein from transposon TNT 1-94 [Tanacetum coccineum]
MIITIPHNLYNLVDSTEKFMNEIGELRAIFGHVLGASGVQIPQNNLDNLQLIREEENGATEVSNPRDLSGSIFTTCFGATTSRGMGTLRCTLLVEVNLVKGSYHSFVLPEGFDPLALVEGSTPVEDNRGLLVTLGMLPDDVTVSANQIVFFLLIGMTATNFLLGADNAILSGADNRPPMLEKDMYDSWKSIMELYMMNRQHGRMILESVENGPLIWPKIEENRVTRPKKYSKLSTTEAIQVDCDIKATNIILQGINHQDLCMNNNGTEFVNQTLREYYEKVGISHETSVARSPQQNGVVERRNRTLIEAARTMLIYAKAPLFLWAEAVATACYTQNRSIIRLRHGKTPYELLHDKPPDLSFFHVFGALCYPTNDSENLGKLQPKADIDFDELTAMASKHSSSGPALHEMTPATISSRLVPNPPPSTPFVPPSRSDWDLLFQPLFDELLTHPPSVDHPV